jgi:hypothetical protein
MRELAGAHHLGFDKEVERRLLTCSDESSSKACVHRSTMSGGSGLALSDGVLMKFAKQPQPFGSDGVGGMERDHGKGTIRDAPGRVSHLPLFFV